jgi:tetratricopeptide (TPR) repeat protein
MPNPAKNSLHNAHNTVLHYVCESGWLILIPMIMFAGYCILDFHRRRSLSILVLVGTSLVDVHLQQFSSQILLIYLLATHQQGPLQIPTIPITLQPLFLPAALTLGIMAPLMLHQQIYAGFLKSTLMSSQDIQDLKKYRETLEFNPWPIPVLKVQYLKLGSLIEEGHYDRALAGALKLHQLFSGYYLMEHIIGRLYLLKQEPELALIWVEKAIDLHPMEEENYLLLSEIYITMGEVKKADDAMKQYLSLGLRNQNFRDLYISSEKPD